MLKAESLIKRLVLKDFCVCNDVTEAQWGWINTPNYSAVSKNVKPTVASQYNPVEWFLNDIGPKNVTLYVLEYLVFNAFPALLAEKQH